MSTKSDKILENKFEMNRENLLDSHLYLLSHEKREESFGKNWKFSSDESCSASKMAAAGFYYVGTKKEPDLVRCYYCLRELDGWESQDIPWEEHKRKPCPFISLNKPVDEITLGDSLKLESERQIALLKQKYIEEIAKIRQEAESVRNILSDIVSNKKKQTKRGRKK